MKKRARRKGALLAGVMIAVLIVAVVGARLLFGLPESALFSGFEPKPQAVATPTGGVSATSAAPCGWLPKAPTKYHHVLWIWEENQSASQVKGKAPYFDAVSAKCGTAAAVEDSATTVALPSEPQYAAATSGSNCDRGITSKLGGGSGCLLNDDAGTALGTQSIFQLAKSSGGSWKSYQESMRSNCAQSDGGGYAFKHNPAAFYTQIRSDCNALDVPIAAINCEETANGGCASPGKNALTNDITAGNLPTFAFITPNLDNDMHDGTVAQGDNWLNTYLSLLVAGPNYKSGDTAIFIMWDEGSSNSSDATGLATTVIAPSIPPGTVARTMTNNIGLLKTTQEILGLTPLLGCASGTPPGEAGACNAGSDVSLRPELHL